MEPIIKKEFQNLINPLTPEEYDTLEKNILAEGLRDPLVIWEEKGILLDGHNRLKICQQHGIKITQTAVPLSDENHAINWILTNQLGRRNATPNQKTYLMGKQYNLEKSMHGGDRKSEQLVKSKAQSEPLKPTGDVLAEKNNVSKSTIKRAGKYAEDVETVSSLSDDPTEQRRNLLSGKDKLSKKDLTKLADMSKENKAEARKYFEELKSGLPAKKPAEHSHKKITIELPIATHEKIKELQKKNAQTGKKLSVAEIFEQAIHGKKTNDLEILTNELSKQNNEKPIPESKDISGLNNIVFVTKSSEEISKQIDEFLIEASDKYPHDHDKCVSVLNEKERYQPVLGGYRKWSVKTFQDAIRNARWKQKIQLEKERDLNENHI